MPSEIHPKKISPQKGPQTPKFESLIVVLWPSGAFLSVALAHLGDRVVRHGADEFTRVRKHQFLSGNVL